MMRDALYGRAACAQTLLAGDAGERRLTDVLHLVELLHAAGRTERLQPQALIEWLERQIERRDRSAPGALCRLESDADAVQITTVHRSKGLGIRSRRVPLPGAVVR